MRPVATPPLPIGVCMRHEPKKNQSQNYSQFFRFLFSH